MQTQAGQAGEGEEEASTSPAAEGTVEALVVAHQRAARRTWPRSTLVAMVAAMAMAPSAGLCP